MNSKKITVIALVYLQILAGCVTTGGRYNALKVGPKPISTDTRSSTTSSGALKLEVIIPAFDPGLSEEAENYEVKGVWPELRRAEANRFAIKLKQALDDTTAFGAVRVTPDETASGDLYILGRIDESNGQEAGITLNVVDISGRTWLSKSFEHETSEGFYKNQRNKGKDPYDPMFEEATNALVELLKKRSTAQLKELKHIAELRFGAHFSDQFMQHMETNRGKTKLVSRPADNDPTVQRTRALRIREQIFTDGMQQNYLSFYEKINDSYLKWQEANMTELQLQAKAKSKAIWQGAAGVLLLALGAAAASAGAGENSSAKEILATGGAVAGGLAGAWMLSNSFKSKEEAELHRDTLDELGESVDLEFSPQVVEFENKTVELTGNAKEQFAQWRAFLQKIHAQETTPDVTL